MFCNKFKSHRTCAVRGIICSLLDLYILELAMELLKYHLLALALLTCQGAVMGESMQSGHFQGMNVSARLEEVHAFANLHQVCRGAARDSEPEDCSLC